jgi:GNAT superfamily N-acetyltransferase
MTFPAYRRLLDLRRQVRHPELEETAPARPFGFVAEVAGMPVALALAELQDHEAASAAQLLSVFVEPEMRGGGLAGRLVQAVEQGAVDRGATRLTATYTAGRSGVGRMERILADRGWQSPRAVSLSVRASVSAVLEAPQLDERRMRVVRRGLEFFPWAELDPAEAERVRRSDAERCWIEPSLAPWKYDLRKVHRSSLGVRYRGEVVGWIVNHEVLPGVIRIAVGYMRPDLARRGRTLALYRESIEIMRETGCREYSFVTPMTYPPMIQFIRRWLAPFTLAIRESMATEKSLESESAEPRGS